MRKTKFAIIAAAAMFTITAQAGGGKNTPKPTPPAQPAPAPAPVTNIAPQATAGAAALSASSASSVSLAAAQQMQGQQQTATGGHVALWNDTTAVSGGNTLAGGDQAVSVNTNIINPRNPVSTAYAPALAASTGTCMGSTSVGAQGVGFGVSLGSTWHDNRCDARLESNQLYGMGYKLAATYRMCLLPEVAKAMKAAGTPCPEDQDAARAAQAPATGPAVVYYN